MANEVLSSWKQVQGRIPDLSTVKYERVELLSEGQQLETAEKIEAPIGTRGMYSPISVRCFKNKPARTQMDYPYVDLELNSTRAFANVLYVCH